jgi:glycosyltransferase involved in cell wall biosynthesis
MRITHFLDRLTFETGGPARAVIDLCGALARRGHDVTLLTFDDRDVPEAWKRSGASPRAVRIPEPGSFGLLTPEGKAIADQAIRGADALHIHGVWEPVKAALGALARQAAVPYVISLRGMLDDWSMQQRGLKKRTYLALSGRRFLENAAFVHCTAGAELEQAKKWFPRGRGLVIPNLLDLAPYVSLPGPELARSRFPALTQGRPTALFLSRIHYKKGIELLLQAGALLRRDGLDCNILIAGSGEEGYVASLRRLAEELGPRDRASFLGMVVGNDKLSLYQAVDAFVLPTSQENFGFVIYESLACGTPVVTTKGVDPWPELEAGAGAAIVDAKAEAVAAGMRGLLTDPAVRQKTGERGREWVFRTLDPEILLGQFDDMYRRALDQRR